jgi:hypothetical protein
MLMKMPFYINDTEDTTYWNLGFCYKIKGECDKWFYYLEFYKKNTPKEYWNTKQIEKISNNCK